MGAIAETLTGDGDSTVFQVEQTNPTDFTAETITFQLSGTFNGATATFEVCADPDSSPLVFSALSSGAYTSADADNLSLAAGTICKLVISGSSSPLPSIKYSARGQFKTLA